MPPHSYRPRGSGQTWSIIAAVAVFVVLGVLTLAALGVFTFRTAKSRQAGAREVRAQLEKTAEEERAKMAERIRSGDIQGGDASLGRIKQQLEKSADKLGTSDGAAARAMAGFMGKMQEQVRAYQAAATRFTDAQVFRPTYHDLASIEEQRKIVREFLARNAELTHTLTHGDELLGAELDAAKISPRTRQDVLAGFNRSQAAIRPIQARIREADQTLGNTALVALDLFERYLGRWNRDANTGEMFFTDGAARVAYDALIEQVQATADEQAKAQEELAQLMQGGKKP